MYSNVQKLNSHIFFYFKVSKINKKTIIIIIGIVENTGEN